jgi:fatty acid CoA ligase FadD21
MLPGSPQAVIEIDAHDLCGSPAFSAADPPQTSTAMLQYTSGSTRQPTGVVISHRNLQPNFEHTEFVRLDSPA